MTESTVQVNAQNCVMISWFYFTSCCCAKFRCLCAFSVKLDFASNTVLGSRCNFCKCIAGMKWKSGEFSCALLRRNDIRVCDEWKSWLRLTWEGKT